MRYWTLLEIKTKIENDLDLIGEDFIESDVELVGLINEAIDNVEVEVHGINEDYFLKRGTITLVSGTDEYDLPSDIYGNKIRSIIYRNGNVVREIKRVKNSRKLLSYHEGLISSSSVNGDYEYIIVNETAGSPQIIFIPPVQESGAYVTVWYIRNANRLANDSDVLDIPEAANFVIQDVKVRCYEKEGHPNLPKAVMDLETQKQKVIDSLTNAVPDNDNILEADTSFYDEMT